MTSDFGSSGLTYYIGTTCQYFLFAEPFVEGDSDEMLSLGGLIVELAAKAYPERSQQAPDQSVLPLKKYTFQTGMHTLFQH